MVSGRTRETRIRRDSLGRWFDGEVPITHALLTQAFDAWIERAEDGRYCLKNDINWAYVEIEGAPVFVRSVELEGEHATMHLSDGRDERLDPATLRQSREGALHCQVRGGRLPAQFDSHAALQLAPVIDEDDDGTFVALEGTRARPPVVEDALAWPS